MRLEGVLHVYKGEWGLPSIDFECLRALCLVKFTRCPVQIRASTSPLSAGKLPYLQIGNKKFVGYREIKKVLDEEGFPVDRHLTGKYAQLSPAYANWVFSNLHAYYHYFMYAEPNNIDVTQTLYAKRTPFPYNFYYPVSYQKEAHDVLIVMGGFDVNQKLSEEDSVHMLLKAKQCINTLSKKLGKRVWFFGDIFSEFDAIVYSYLSILVNIDLRNNPIQNHIKGCQNILNFLNRISKDIFKHEAFNSKNTNKSTASNDTMLTHTERSFLESEKKTKIFAGIGAVVAMGAFAAWRGLYSQISHVRDFDGLSYDDDDDEEDDME